MKVIALVLALVASVADAEIANARADVYSTDESRDYVGTFIFHENQLQKSLYITFLRNELLEPGKYIVTVHESMDAAENCGCPRSFQQKCTHGASFNLFSMEVLSNNSHTIHQMPVAATLAPNQRNSLFKAAITVYSTSEIESGKKVPKKAKVACGYVAVEKTVSFELNIAARHFSAGSIVLSESAENQGIQLTSYVVLPPAKYALALHEKTSHDFNGCSLLSPVPRKSLPNTSEYFSFDVRTKESAGFIKMILPNITLQQHEEQSIYGKKLAVYDISPSDNDPEEAVYNTACAYLDI